MDSHETFLRKVRNSDSRWMSSTVIDLTDSCRENHERFRILADALMDAGCDDGSILRECHHRGLIACVIANRDDDWPRLEYASWLENNGEPERSEFIRVQCEIAGLCPYKSCDMGDGESCHGCSDQLKTLRLRERELLYARLSPLEDGRMNAAYAYHWMEPLNDIHDWLTGAPIFRRGFAESITCKWSDWLTHADAIRAATPLKRVRLTTAPDWEVQFGDQPGSDGVSWLDGEFDPHLFDNRDVEKATRPGESAVMGLLRLRWPGIDFMMTPMASLEYSYASMFAAIQQAGISPTARS